MPISEITTLEKASHNAIQLSTGQVRYTFTRFMSRDATFDIIHDIWRSTPFHSIMLPNLQVSVSCALTTFESGISPWLHPSEWLNTNVKHIRAIFDGIVDLTGNKTITFPATMIFQVCYNSSLPSSRNRWFYLSLSGWLYISSHTTCSALATKRIFLFCFVFRVVWCYYQLIG